MTGRGLPGVTIHVKNITQVNSTHARADDIDHDVTTGEILFIFSIYKIKQERKTRNTAKQIECQVYKNKKKPKLAMTDKLIYNGTHRIY